tara:strand:- start:7762 stop:8370 length:609 start_codon:yes stop_codon:yes gene_type:complete
MENVNGVSKEVKLGELTAVKFVESQYQKEGTKAVHIQQQIEVIKSYPTKKISNSLSSSLFESSEFDLEPNIISYETTRNVITIVPDKASLEDVQSMLDSRDGAKIYEIVSSKPVLSDEQINSIAEGRNTLTMDDYANRQVLRVPDNAESNAGGLVLDNYGQPQYKAQFFTLTQEDKDIRVDGEFYASPEINAELNETIEVKI